ncbi:MAG: acetyl-CoA acetyltransferase [Alphaproteobacteria bacterium]|nr:MAG: acetyl-CoA acetyltransferase [Alphaproteobacteria bacterium]
MAEAARSALADARADRQLCEAVDHLAVIRTFADSSPQFASPFGGPENYPDAVARRIGCRPKHAWYPMVGGDTPQMMVSLLAERLQRGEGRAALIIAGEAMAGQRLAKKAGAALDWREAAGEDAPALQTPGDPRPGMSPHELAHGIAEPTHVYPLFESAIAAAEGRAMSVHRQRIGSLFARFSMVAAANPHAWDCTARTSDEIWREGPDNRMIAWPYTRRLCAQMFVDQAAAVLLTTVGEARRLAIPPDRWVFLAGSAEVSEKWFLAERVDFARAPAIEVGARAALAQAGIGIDEIDLFDLYSCFPSAVEVAARALGLAEDDPRGLTVTGGLPFFGGPGNGYSLFAIAEMADRLRRRDEPTFGLITANGWYLTKHAFGVYANRPPKAAWHRRPSTDAQARIDALAAPSFTETPEGDGLVEAATVIFDRSGAPRHGLLYGRLGSDGEGPRFVAVTEPGETSSLKALMGERPVGRPLTVRRQGQRNIARVS